MIENMPLLHLMPGDRKGRHYIPTHFEHETCSGDPCGRQDNSQTLRSNPDQWGMVNATRSASAHAASHIDKVGVTITKHESAA
jgi:hypothetical protein